MSVQLLLAVPGRPHHRCLWPCTVPRTIGTICKHEVDSGPALWLFYHIFFLVLILFQAIQERLQAWVNQRSCFLLVNRSNSLEKRILGKKTMQMMLFQIFLILSLIKKTTQLKPYLLLYRSVTNLLTQNNYAFKMRTCLLVVILKWFLILTVVILLKIYVNELNKTDISSQFDTDTRTLVSK